MTDVRIILHSPINDDLEHFLYPTLISARKCKVVSVLATTQADVEGAARILEYLADADVHEFEINEPGEVDLSPLFDSMKKMFIHKLTVFGNWLRLHCVYPLLSLEVEKLSIAAFGVFLPEVSPPCVCNAKDIRFNLDIKEDPVRQGRAYAEVLAHAHNVEQLRFENDIRGVAVSVLCMHAFAHETLKVLLIDSKVEIDERYCDIVQQIAAKYQRLAAFKLRCYSSPAQYVYDIIRAVAELPRLQYLHVNVTQFNDIDTSLVAAPIATTAPLRKVFLYLTYYSVLRIPLFNWLASLPYLDHLDYETEYARHVEGPVPEVVFPELKFLRLLSPVALCGLPYHAERLFSSSVLTELYLNGGWEDHLEVPQISAPIHTLNCGRTRGMPLHQITRVLKALTQPACLKQVSLIGTWFRNIETTTDFCTTLARFTDLVLFEMDNCHGDPTFPVFTPFAAVLSTLPHLETVVIKCYGEHEDATQAVINLLTRLPFLSKLHTPSAAYRELEFTNAYLHALEQHACLSDFAMTGIGPIQSAKHITERNAHNNSHKYTPLTATLLHSLDEFSRVASRRIK